MRELVRGGAGRVREGGVTPHLQIEPGLPTGTIVILVRGEERSMLTERGANAAFSGATLWSFGYDAEGRLVAITDQHENATVVQRDTEGNPLAIVGPFGQQTLLSLGADEMLASVENRISPALWRWRR